MSNQYKIIILIVLIIISISGCTNNKNATNGTFGQKSISIKNISLVDNVTTERTENNLFIIRGYLVNNNKYDVYNLNMKATAFDEQGNIVAVNDTVFLNPKVLYVNSSTFFGFMFFDPDKKIVRYELQIINADVYV